MYPRDYIENLRHKCIFIALQYYITAVWLYVQIDHSFLLFFLKVDKTCCFPIKLYAKSEREKELYENNKDPIFRESFQSCHRERRNTRRVH